MILKNDNYKVTFYKNNEIKYNNKYNKYTKALL